MAEGDNPPVGRLLCTDKDQTKVEPSGARQTASGAARRGERSGANQYATGGLDHQLFVSRNLVALPKPEQLEQLIETNRAAWEQHHPSSSPAGDQS